MRAILTRALPARTRRLIMVLTPGHEFRAGGVIAITALYRESLALGHVHGARVVLCTVPGDPPILKYRWFQGARSTLDPSAVLRRCRHLDHLLLHIPEYVVDQVADWLATVSPTLLRNVRALHCNVMVFNIDYVRGGSVAALTRFGAVTVTTGHASYSSAATRALVGVPVHELRVCMGAELYARSEYEDKESLLVVSHDPHPLKASVLETIARGLPGLRIQVVQDLSYEEYKALIRRAKWSLTFGEGLDAYFVEPVFSGSIAFAVFNARFFTPVFGGLETVYPSWPALADRIVADLRRLDEPAAYRRCWRQAYDVVSDHLSTDRFRRNLRRFYGGDYSFP
jgi:hypothetical protein